MIRRSSSFRSPERQGQRRSRMEPLSATNQQGTLSLKRSRQRRDACGNRSAFPRHGIYVLYIGLHDWESLLHSLHGYGYKPELTPTQQTPAIALSKLGEDETNSLNFLPQALVDPNVEG